MTGGSAIGEKGGGEDRTEDFEPFDFRNEHAEALAGMDDVFAPEPEDEAANRGVTDFVETIQR